MTDSDAPTALVQKIRRMLVARKDPAAQAEHLRAVYRDYVFNSPLVICLSVYLYVLHDNVRSWPFLQTWLPLWVLYLSARMLAGLVFTQGPVLDPLRLKRWSGLALLIQLIDGLMVSSLGLFVYPQLDPMAQAALLAATLVLVGATAFSLAGRWLSILVYAPPIYLSFAWATLQQTHSYAPGFALLTLGMFALYLVYASNQRKSVLKGFELAKLNGQLADELMTKNSALEDVAAERSRLLATVSHDLRQPAHAIGLLAERALLDSSADSTRQCLRDLNELSQSLSASLTTLMDLTRLDAGLVEPRQVPIALAPLLARLERQFEVASRSKGLRLLVDRGNQWVSSDPVLLQALLANLVSNAVKYTANGIVEVKVSRVDDEVCVCVCDTGIGVRYDKLDIIFKEFVRLDGTVSGTEGLGLGLSIVKRYAALMGHRLSVESLPAQGSRFSVFIKPAEPVKLDDSNAQAQEGAAQMRLRSLRVLVVDNVDLLLGSMVKTLAGWGCQVHGARNLVQAIDISKSQPIDLLISDYHLGDLEPDGLQLIRALQQRSPAPLPALLMTGDVSSRLELDARSQGVPVLHKPVRPQLLREQVLARLASDLSPGRDGAAAAV
jgi:signal transduction histidine kinase